MYTLLLTVFLWLLLLSHGLRIRTNQDLRPEFSYKKDICAVVGRSFNVNCSLTYASKTNEVSSDDENFNLSLLKILHCNKHRNNCFQEKTTLLDNTTVTLFKDNLSNLDNGTYFCQYNNSEETEDNFHLSVGYKPVGPTDVRCVSVDLEDLKCTWNMSSYDSSNALPPVNYVSYFKSKPQYDRFDCPLPGPKTSNPRDDRECSILSSRHAAKITFHPYNTYTLFIKAENCLGKKKRKYNITLTEIVKLSPPVLLIQSITSRSIVLVMTLSKPLVLHSFHVNVIVYNITYTSEYTSTTSTKIIESSNISTKVPLNDLVPFSTYTITVRSRGPESKYWSDKVMAKNKTDQSAPEILPQVGGYFIQNRSLNIYLKPISLHEKYSSTAYYTVTVKKNLTTVRQLNATWDVSMVKINITVQNHFEYQIQLQTVNNVGSSQNTTSIEIPAMVKHVPVDIEVEKADQNYTVLWNDAGQTHDIHSGIVHWCHGNRRQKQCESDVNWIVVQNQTAITIPELEDKVGGDWMFGVSFRYNDGRVSSIVFSECYFPSVTEVPTAVAPFDVVAENEDIHVKPLTYCSYPSRPLQFTAYYKETDKQVSHCDHTFSKKTVKASINTKEVILTGLQSDTIYVICLGVHTTAGAVKSLPQTVRTLTYGSSVNAFFVVFGVIIGVVVMSAIFYIMRKVMKKWNTPFELHLPTIRKSPAPVNGTVGFIQNTQQTESLLSSSDSGFSSNHPSKHVTGVYSTTEYEMTEFEMNNKEGPSNHSNNDNVIYNGELSLSDNNQKTDSSVKYISSDSEIQQQEDVKNDSLNITSSQDTNPYVQEHHLKQQTTIKCEDDYVSASLAGCPPTQTGLNVSDQGKVTNTPKQMDQNSNHVTDLILINDQPTSYIRNVDDKSNNIKDHPEINKDYLCEEDECDLSTPLLSDKLKNHKNFDRFKGNEDYIKQEEYNPEIMTSYSNLYTS